MKRLKISFRFFEKFSKFSLTLYGEGVSVKGRGVGLSMIWARLSSTYGGYNSISWFIRRDYILYSQYSLNRRKSVFSLIKLLTLGYSKPAIFLATKVCKTYYENLYNFGYFRNCQVLFILSNQSNQSICSFRKQILIIYTINYVSYITPAPAPACTPVPVEILFVYFIYCSLIIH